MPDPTVDINIARTTVVLYVEGVCGGTVDPSNQLNPISQAWPFVLKHGLLLAIHYLYLYETTVLCSHSTDRDAMSKALAQEVSVGYFVPVKLHPSFKLPRRVNAFTTLREHVDTGCGCGYLSFSPARQALPPRKIHPKRQDMSTKVNSKANIFQVNAQGLCIVGAVLHCCYEHALVSFVLLGW